MTIVVYDEKLSEWRRFTVVPYAPDFLASCRGTMHQFAVGATVCTCGKIGAGNA